MFRKITFLFIVLLVVVFIAMQFFQPGKNLEEPTEQHLFNTAHVSAEVQGILKNACMDCHSNNTNYLWYHKISPVSWYIHKHIADGKKALDFSVWGGYSKLEKIGMLDEVCEETKEKTMPLKSYTWMHKKANLTEKEIETLCNWAESYAEELLLEK